MGSDIRIPELPADPKPLGTSKQLSAGSGGAWPQLGRITFIMRPILIYLTPQNDDINKRNYPSNWGILATPSRFGHRISAGRSWGGDNEVFTGRFEWDRFYNWLTLMRDFQSSCLFIVAPDAVADPHQTRDLFDRYASSIKELGYPVAFVAQDGQENLPFPDFDALFIGGTTEWKMSEAADWCIRWAQKHQKWVHIGRVNSQKRLRHFQLVGANSVDGTTIAFAPDRMRARLQRQLDKVPLFQVK